MLFASYKEPNDPYMDVPGGARVFDATVNSGRTARLYPACEYTNLLQP